MITLTIDKNRFNWIVYGGALAEYKRVSPYWQKRLLSARTVQNCPPGCKGLQVIIQAGYHKNAPRALLTLSHVDTGAGLEHWGAVPGVEYYRLHIDRVEVLST